MIKITTIIIIITTAPFYPVCCVTSISSSPLDLQCQKEIANQILDLCLSYFEKLIFCWSVELSPRSLEYTTDSESKTPERKILLTLSASISAIFGCSLEFRCRLILMQDQTVLLKLKQFYFYFSEVTVITLVL